jgi:hypothetical protein
VRSLALVGFSVCLLATPAALAQKGVSSASPRSEVPLTTGTSRLPLDAMLHHQPRAGDVARREGQAGNDDQDLRRQKEELDALYNDIMARSAPKK